MVEYVPGQRLVFEAFDDYWQGKPPFRRVVVLMINDFAMAYRSQVARTRIR